MHHELICIHAQQSICQCSLWSETFPSAKEIPYSAPPSQPSRSASLLQMGSGMKDGRLLPQNVINGSTRHHGSVSQPVFEIGPRFRCVIQCSVPFCCEVAPAVCHYSSVFIHLPLIDSLGCFQLGAVLRKAVRNILVPGFCGLLFSFLLHKYLHME